MILSSFWKKANVAHGSARWATNKELRKAGLYSKDGAFVGLSPDGSEYLRHNGPEHICAFAPTRSGKGVGLVIPTLLNWQESVICFDPKGENWRLTSGFRRNLGRCLYFDPTSLGSLCFNPLAEIRKGPHEIKDAQNIADILVDPEGSGDKRNHWDRTAHSLLVASILHVTYCGQDKSLTGVERLLADPERPFSDALKAMLETNHLEGSVHPVVASGAREMLNKAESERSGVLSTALSYLALFKDPIVARATSASDFKIRDLRNEKEPVSLYLVIPPSDISRTKALIRLILNQIGRALTEELPTKNQKRRILFLIDEFPILGKLDFFESSLAYLAGYNIKAFLIMQSLNQIEKVYGANNSILDNCHIKIAFASNDDRTAKRISDLLGVTTETKRQSSVSGRRASFLFSNSSQSDLSFARPLLTPSEINQLDETKEIIFVAGKPPILAKKMLYYKDKNFSARILDPVPITEGPMIALPKVKSITINNHNETKADNSFNSSSDGVWPV